ncbi:hypothetical protein [Variovorax sp. dw_954]|uniref:hypothetical protein n=1 Tax=Variovorax sp. dw_954 TaxID=2720078 RepID=UPI001BD639DB|nr:hypothetical protein [Variovorax sp. dw_954]
MITAHIEMILLVTGLLTASMIVTSLAPSTVLRLVYGDKTRLDDVGLLVARHWGVLVFCNGALIVAAAWMPELRTPVLIASVLQKLTFVTLQVAIMRGRGMTWLLAGGDLVFSILYLLYLTQLA